MSKALASPYPGYTLGLLGLLLTWLAGSGFGGAFSCGTWSLDCGLAMVIVTFLFQGGATLLLWIAARRSRRATAGRYIAIAGCLATALAALAAGAVLAFLAFAMVSRGIV